MVKDESKTKATKLTVTADTPISEVGGLHCVGDICITKEGNIEIDVTNAECPPNVIRELLEKTIKGAKFTLVAKPPEQK